MVAVRWIEQGYNASLVLHSVGLASSTYYNHRTRRLKAQGIESKPKEARAGRPIPGYTYIYSGRKISYEQVKEFIMEEISGDGYPYGYHIGLRALGPDALRTLKQAITAREVVVADELILRTDNGPQFTSNVFQDGCAALPVTHTRIPVNTPNMNAHIESFHSILASDCLRRHDFRSYAEAYKEVTEFMKCYNHRRRHGGLKNKAPFKFYLGALNQEIQSEMMVA